MQTLCKAKYSPELDELRKNIAEIDQVSNRPWLLSKVDEMRGRKSGGIIKGRYIGRELMGN